jgi:hypothetical protein
VGEGGIKERMGATRTLAPIFPDNFPEHLREEYARIREDLVWVPPDEGSGQGLAESTLDAMTEDEAEVLAKRLFSLYTNAAQTFYGR